MRYTKKPEIVEAFQLLPDIVIKNLPSWVRVYWGPGDPSQGCLKLVEHGVIVGTPEGNKLARWNDYIIYEGRDDKDSDISKIRPCNQIIFHQQYTEEKA